MNDSKNDFDYKELISRHKKAAIGIGSGLIVLILIVGVLIWNSNGKSNSEMIRPGISSGKLSASAAGSADSTDFSSSSNENPVGDGEYDYAEAKDHIGEEAVVTGKVVSVFTSKTNTTFLNYCSDFKKCPFSVVIFASDKEKFGDVKKLVGERKIKGLIKSYQGKAEIILEEKEQML